MSALSKIDLKSFILFLFCAATAGCSHSPAKGSSGDAKVSEEKSPISAKPSPTAGASIEAKELAAKEEATYVTEISFRLKRSELTNDAKARLKKIISQALAKTKISEIKSIAWADSEFPSVNATRLPDSQIKLADARNEAIRNFIRTLQGNNEINVSAYSMAKRSGLINGLISPDEKELKKSLEMAGIPNTDTSSKPSPKASKAIVLIVPAEPE